MRALMISLTLFVAAVSLPGCPGGGEPQSHTLTLRFESLEAESRFKHVWVCVDGVRYSRATFPFDKNIKGGSPFVQNIIANQEFYETTIGVEHGKFVTLVAFDGQDSFFSGVSQFTNLDEINFVDANEFDHWAGDVSQNELLNSDFGEVAFVMEGDRTVSAVYRRMPTFVLRAEVNEEPNASPGVLINAYIPTYLYFPDQTMERTENFGIGNGDRGAQLVGAVRTGSLITLMPNPKQSDPSLLFDRWDGDCMGGECVVTAAENIDVTSVWFRFGIK